MKKNRIIILGENSFVASNLINLLNRNNDNFISISKKKIDLTKNSSVKQLKKIINPNDILIFISAIAPVKNFKMLYQNLDICKNVFKVLKDKKIKYLLYVSSDAVYSDSKIPITEKSNTEPENLHGLMHLTREKILKLLDIKMCIVRPTLVYGSNDPHNGYGPNLFVRNAQSKKYISLFGRGEERRDHIHVNDVGEIIYFLVKKKYIGTINLVTGKIFSFFKIAKVVKDIYGSKIKYIKRNGPMPHNGYRAFNNNLLKKVLPNNKKLIHLLNWLKKKEKYKKR